MKMGMFAALAGLAVSGAASAAFTGFEVVRTVEGGLARHVLNATFNGATDTVLNAFHLNRTNGQFGGLPVFFHNDALSGGSSSAAGTWNPQFLLAPGALDSYVCIGGGEGFASGNSTNADPDWGAAGFGQAQIPFLAAGTTSAGPGWFNGNPPNNQGLQSGGKVRLGQFVVSATAARTDLFIKIGYNTGPNTTVVFAEGTFRLNVPAPGAVALLGLAGLAGRRRR
ncbi:MAG: hypothetical protein ACKOYN_10120 [Planctomycetota bacterium]